MEKLYLSRNKIESINEKAFKHLSSLRNLDFRDNKLERIDENALEGLENLDELDLSKNLFEYEILFSNLPNLKIIAF